MSKIFIFIKTIWKSIKSNEIDYNAVDFSPDELVDEVEELKQNR